MKYRFQTFLRSAAVLVAGAMAAASAAAVSLPATIALMGVACVLAAAGLSRGRLDLQSA